jgi:hypothetical protein
MNQGIRWLRFVKKTRGWRSRDIITLREPQFSSKFSQDSRVKINIDSCESCYEISVCKTCKKRVSLQNLSARLSRSKSCYEISVCKTRKKRVLLQNLSARLVRSKSRYEISVCETREERVWLLVLTPESRENLARILASRENFKKWFSCQPYLWYGRCSVMLIIVWRRRFDDVTLFSGMNHT